MNISKSLFILTAILGALSGTKASVASSPEIWNPPEQFDAATLFGPYNTYAACMQGAAEECEERAAGLCPVGWKTIAHVFTEQCLLLEYPDQVFPGFNGPGVYGACFVRCVKLQPNGPENP